IDSDTSKRSASQSIEKEEERQWKETWSKEHKPETGIQAMHRGGPFWGKVREAAEKKLPPPTAGPSHILRSSDYASSSIPNRMTCVEEDLDHIRHFQAYQVKHNQAVAEMLRTMALHHGMNMDNFPTCPSYIPPRDKAVLDDDDDDEDDEEDEEDEE
ncbi:hypothetical protein H5410_000702, partial [Solanum commersonii]